MQPIDNRVYGCRPPLDCALLRQELAVFLGNLAGYFVYTLDAVSMLLFAGVGFVAIGFRVSHGTLVTEQSGAKVPCSTFPGTFG